MADLRTRRWAIALLLAATALPASAQEEGAVAQRGSGGDIVAYEQIHGATLGRGGMVASQSAPATRVGTEILRQGGNAVDAAIATAFAEAVTLPRAGNLGGGGYMVVHMAARDGKPATTITINYYGLAPRATTPSLLLGTDGKQDPSKVMSFKGVAVPGTVAGLWEAHQRFGTLPWAKLVEPAIRLARDGVPLSDGEAEATAGRAKMMARDPGARAAFFKPDGSPYAPGELFRQPNLAWSLEQIASRGRDGFYKGELARRLVAGIKAGGGVIDARDLADFKAAVAPPIWSSYRGQRIAYMPPTASGVSVAEAMNILETFPLKQYGWGSVNTLHLISEAMKIASSDRRFVGGEPQWKTPAIGLASKAYAAERAKLITLNGSLTAATLPDGNPYRHESPDTTHFSVADKDGNAVANTYTLTASYGAHVVAPGTGFLLNNSLGNFAWGSKDPARKATWPAPGKRLGSTITPMIVFRGEKPWLVTGTPGGGYIIAPMVQVLVNAIDFNLNIAEAAERPRLNQGAADAPLELESGFSPDIIPLLEARGHKVRLSNTMGSTQSIMIEGDKFMGASDTRRPDALALGVR
ncbi:gamma-glutamyltransferase [Sphingomonas aracearum]|uniref:Glutathione hydrolase proenzyme n=1 Tax=Sphingomonas aracearum TaxID=2283317 RepID=A0A369W4K9_9SPHN|nr:gamma-glutamyltransferase [Sphingomonas aracearum]RDE06991.1 gamma-glutamyltransferase [Sphingomonas aracearum]